MSDGLTVKSIIGEQMIEMSCRIRVKEWMRERGIDEDTALTAGDIVPIVVEFSKQYYADALRVLEQYEELRKLDYATRNQPIVFTGW